MGVMEYIQTWCNAKSQGPTILLLRSPRRLYCKECPLEPCRDLPDASVGSLTRVNWTDGGPSEVVGSFETPPTHRRVRLDRAADDASKPGSELEVVQDPEVIRPPSWGSRRRAVVGRHQS
ncbi:hypothetical protein CNYM01_00833 [Colletotrichum nymphaeae SA-01]|uniref:Uncharacterized protein n=1 Tax=Colletotrichum nymphaeae SA-01 TaxID=1460502 RepID=A0A135TBH5_9PEZI|nr:hypothetical protein CNYM01_00833 [Colletotrichum nymphaeae SA-01]